MQTGAAGSPATGGVQLFDEVETLRGDKDRFDALITVLNVRFVRGGVVSRLEKRGERFVEEPYEVYAPRVLAGIPGLKDTLEDRSLEQVMFRRRKDETVARLGRETDAEAQRLRDACALACLTRIEDILTAYDGAPKVLDRQDIDDRAVDLWAPLAKKTKKDKVPFGGYEVRFEGRTDTLEELFGAAPMPPSEMTKRLWEFVKRHRLATKG